jgi:hypothetical protein
LREQIDPKLYELPPRTVLMNGGSNEFILVINRKSRIIMKDAVTILKKTEKIKAKVLNARVVVETNAPVCSKSVQFLKDNGISLSLIQGSHSEVGDCIR